MKKNNLYLGQLIARDSVKYGSNNLIISPVGSGKTHFIMNTLSKEYIGKKLMLVSTTSLKDSFDKIVGTFSTQDLRRGKLKLSDESIYIMTYAEFGDIVRWKDNFTKDYSVIFCDEIHSLFDYFFINESYKLAKAITTLFKSYDDKTIFYFTATTHKIDIFIDREYKDLYGNVKVIDYNEDENVKRYHNLMRKQFASPYEIEDVIISLEDYKLAGKAGVIFNERIDGMGRITDILERRGYNSISIWSTNNEDNAMNEEQLRVRGILLNEGLIPIEYDFIIINGAMREGWSLLDERVEIVILNTLDETSMIQARGRVRKDIMLLFVRALGEVTPIEVRIMERERSLGVIDKYLGKEINKLDKDDISNLLGVARESDGKPVKWLTINKTLKSNGYEVIDLRKVIDGKKVSLSIITKIEDISKSSVSKASRFVSNLDNIGFTSENSVILSNYMKLGKEVAFSHIISSYKHHVISGDWSERDFADVTYIIARDNLLFSKTSYSNIGSSYKVKMTDMEILKERAKYETSSMVMLMQIVEDEKAKDLEIENELLDYIANNSA